jgi:hypothetical protein
MTLEQKIAASLNQALENGYDMAPEPDVNIAIDMISCDATFELYRVSELLPGIAAWKAEREQSNR